MSSFSSDESVALNRTIEFQECILHKPYDTLETAFELNTCEDWIKTNSFKAICLQFPDSLLSFSDEISLHLSRKTNASCYILADTSYGSCCVDEVAAQHINAEAIIHFGHSCLSPTSGIPVLFVFEKHPLDAEKFLSNFQQYLQHDSKVILLYDVAYKHCIDNLSAELKEYHNLIIPKLLIKSSTKEDINKHSIILGRIFPEDVTKDIEDYTVVCIGKDGLMVTNFVLRLKPSSFLLYDPSLENSFKKIDYQNSTKFLMRRMYLIEKVKDVKTIGILVGTLTVTGFQSAIDRIKYLCKKKNKKTYIIAVGKPNVAKLANFPEIELYVLVACPENCLLDSKEYYQPIVTPYEVELAFSTGRTWDQRYITDFRDLLPDGAEAADEKEEDEEAHISLVSGQLRNLSTEQKEDFSPSSALSIRSEMKVAISGSTGSQYLLNRSWKGLEQNLGQTEVQSVAKGQKGIAGVYENEDETIKNTET